MVISSTPPDPPHLIRAPLLHVHSRMFDSRRWAGYMPRHDDIIIGTYSKSGTTWMQCIVSMLVFRDPYPKPLWELSPWLELRAFETAEEALARAEALTHRRFFKTHLPYDALPVHEGVKFIHVARDGRDAAMSLYNHMAHLTEAAVDGLNGISINDPKFGNAYLPIPHDPAAFFREWVESDGGEGDEAASYFHIENSYWEARHQPNMLLVHYNDLLKDRRGEIERVAEFLQIDVTQSLLTDISEAAGFESMKKNGEQLIAAASFQLEGGSQRFLNKGANQRWRGIFDANDLTRFAAKSADTFPPDLLIWLEHGRAPDTA